MRYLPLTPEDRADMLSVIGAEKIDDLFKDVDSDKLNPVIDLPTRASEMAVERSLGKWASENMAAGSVPFFCGAGAYRHHIPASVDHIIQRGEFLTSYTPYQPEIAQGTLQYIFEFQTQVAAMAGMDVANASLYDGSTSCGEALLMARRVTRKKRAVIAGNVHPHYTRVCETMTRFTDDIVDVLETQPRDPEAELQQAIDAIDDLTSCVIFQNPGLFGHVLDLTPLAEKAQAHKALLVVVVTEAVSLGLLKTPGAMGADIVVGEGQSIGVGLNFGGPYLGLFATRDKYIRQMPGRLCGETVDADGRRGYVLTLSTREQHIRREKATSNICTNSGLCALAFTAHMAVLGGTGLRQLAEINHNRTRQLAGALEAAGFEVLTKRYFNEIAVDVKMDAASLVDRLSEQDILGGVPAARLYPDGDFPTLLLLAATETITEADIDALVSGIQSVREGAGQ